MSTISNTSTQETSLSSLSTTSSDSAITGEGHSGQSVGGDDDSGVGEYTEAYTTAITGGGRGMERRNQKKKLASRRSTKRKVRIDQNNTEALVEGGAASPSVPIKKSKKENPLMKIKYRLSKSLRRVLEDTDFKDQKALSRPDVVKGLWQHIKRNDLQIAVNGKRDHIRVSGPLKRLFDDKEHIQMFAMNKELSKHLERVQT